MINYFIKKYLIYKFLKKLLMDSNKKPKTPKIKNHLFYIYLFNF